MGGGSNHVELKEKCTIKSHDGVVSEFMGRVGATKCIYVLITRIALALCCFKSHSISSIKKTRLTEALCTQENIENSVKNRLVF